MTKWTNKLYRMIAAVCNRKLYSLVLSCTYLCKIPAEKTFLCFADKIGFVFALLVFYLFRYLFVRAFPVQVKPVWVKPAQEKPFLGKSLKCGEFGAVFGWTATAPIQCEPAQTGAFFAATGAACGDVVE